MTARLATKVSQRREQIQNLEAKVTQWCDKAHKIQVDVDDNPLVCLVVLFPRTHGASFDVVVV